MRKTTTRDHVQNAGSLAVPFFNYLHILIYYSCVQVHKMVVCWTLKRRFLQRYTSCIQTLHVRLGPNQTNTEGRANIVGSHKYCSHLIRERVSLGQAIGSEAITHSLLRLIATVFRP